MSLINTAQDKFIIHPTDQFQKIKVDAVWIVPTQVQKIETIVQVILFREVEQSEYVEVEKPQEEWADQEVPETMMVIPNELMDGRMIGYFPALNGTPFNIGNANTHMGMPTFEQDLHDFAISILGATFEKI